MKVLVSIMIITIGVLVFFIVGNDSDIQIDSPVSPQQSLDAYNLNDHKDMPAQHTETSSSKSEAKSNESNKVYAKNTSSSSSDSRPYDQDTSYNNQGNSNYGNTSSSYNQSNSNYPGTGSSYSQSNTGYGNASSSYNQNNSNYDRTSSTSSSNSQTTSSNTTSTTSTEKSDTANNDQNDANSENTETAEDTSTAEETNANEEQEDTNNTKYQRLYDNGIMWSGNTGMLMVEYQSSDAQTTGIGFRVHFDSSAIRPINVQQFPVDAIIQTSPQTVMADTSNRDNNTNTDQYLPFAWASIYGQWPQTNQVTLATIEFERVEGGSANDTINYTAVSVPAGFRLIK